MSGIASMSNTYGLPGNSYGLIDKTRQAVGLSEFDIKSSPPLVSQRDNLIFFDTRSCIGELSLKEAQLSFAFNAATSGKIPPGDFKKILKPNGEVSLYKLLDVVDRLNRDGLLSGFPTRKTQDPYIKGNTIRFQLEKKFKLVKSLEFINITIPRDIIPMYVYFPGFIEYCLPFKHSSTTTSFISSLNEGQNSIWESPIPVEINDFVEPEMSGVTAIKLAGVFETPLKYWRTYTGPISMANPHTPPPYQLWNPPQDNFSNDPWPFQPKPVRQQRIPTYRAKNGVVFSGYGLYDLEDFPTIQEVQLANGNIIEIPLRKLFLKLIVPEQYVNGISAEQLINLSNDNDFNESGIVDNPLTQTGYGDYQRFLPGPGVGMNYQPNQYRNGKASPIDLSISTYDFDTGILGPMPVPFPNFRGNVWGPYGRPGDRFQNNSLQATVDELFLNGDLNNNSGNSIIYDGYVPSETVYTFKMLSTVLKRTNDVVKFQNFETSFNPNVKNSMRVVYDGGFGAVYAYVGSNNTERGRPGPIVTGGLPNTQYDGNIHRLNTSVWITPRESNPTNWIDTLPGPQKPTIVKDDTFNGWLYVWRNVYPWTGKIYIPITAGGVGTMEHFDEEWKKTVGSSQDINYTYGSSSWSVSPVIGKANSWCYPITDWRFPAAESIGNLPWGFVETTSLSTGGSGYIVYESDGITKIIYNLVDLNDNSVGGTLEINSINAQGTILTYTETFTGTLDTIYTVIPQTNTITVGNNATFIVPSPGPAINLTTGGSNYTTATNVSTIASSSGYGLTIDILSIGVYGNILSYVINDPGIGYTTNAVVTVQQVGSDLNATIRIDSATEKDDNVIPDNNIFHYMDPLAVGPSAILNGSSLNVNYTDGIDVCTTDCDGAPDENCTFPSGEYQFTIGSANEDASTANNDPTPTPDPPSLLKCDFLNLEGPETEWTNSNKACRPLDNARIRQQNNYINRRVAYNDRGPENGALISNLINYRSLFISSTPDTDFVIHIRQADRTTYTQSVNSNLTGSNFYTPIRLNLGTTTGTQEYVEATQGTLVGGGQYWIKQYDPPLAELGDLELSFTTYDGTPIPIERTLGFLEQLKGFSNLFTATITTSFMIHGNFNDYIPNLPPFTGITSQSPSSIIVSASPNPKSLKNPFDPYTNSYTQRNINIIFKVITYHPENPGITEIVKTMPGHENFQSAESDGVKLIPLASNIDDYTR